MATSESDDFESADEELNARSEHTNRPKRYASIGSDSDDDVDYIPVHYHTPIRGSNNEEHKISSQRKRSSVGKINDKPAKIYMESKSISDSSVFEQNEETAKNKEETCKTNINNKITLEYENNFYRPSEESKHGISLEENTISIEKSKSISNRRERPQRQRKPREVQSLGVKKLGAVKIDKLPNVEITDETTNKEINETQPSLLIQDSLDEFYEKNLQEELRITTQNDLKQENRTKEEPVNVPAELMSNLKFKDIFKPDGWEGLGNDIELPEDLSDDKYHPVLDKLASSSTEPNSFNGNWGGWGTWSVNSLLNSATVGVSTLTSHVSHGLSMLEESMGVPDPANLVKSGCSLEENSMSNENAPENLKENECQPLSTSFGFGNLISSMSSITKLVESTSTKVISGGLDTLESIGKKTMEVLQEGDPGLKKKRAFFLNENDKPILSQILREAKEKAEVAEKSIEEKQLARKVHFESLFDDYQGLMHLEALEILSKQCNMKIQQQLINLDGNELTSMQETLDEVKDLCDLGDEDDEDDEDDEEQDKKDLKQKLQEACNDLDISITYDKLIDIWDDLNNKFSKNENSKNISYREIFQRAISTLAEFTAYSVERFHKTAELLLIKERRSTVNEADCLVQLIKILSSQIGSIANVYCYQLNNHLKNESNESEIDLALKAISLEATNASSYIQEALRLLIPILQVGAM